MGVARAPQVELSCPIGVVAPDAVGVQDGLNDAFVVEGHGAPRRRRERLRLLGERRARPVATAPPRDARGNRRNCAVRPVGVGPRCASAAAR